jgi:hypothetical protein
MKIIREQWLVEAVSLHDDGMRVTFDTRSLDPGNKPVDGSSSIGSEEDGDYQIQVSLDEGRWYARRVGQRIPVTLSIGEVEVGHAG